ncbi:MULTISPECIES: hypothetical protein [Bacillus]|uniref:Uncharacterized protein n=3 Tax=Bacillus inaquosorum TaxID=483913 RepID=A0A9W5LG21_9BACI|nr:MULTISPECIES: hypothetical protein [Bacillus]ARV46763.1 hypothetical protein BCV50_17985 [Bacillus subtilis]MDZ5722902.1 hypothetical protein [Bacillus sp. SXabc123]AMA53659.1 hypothetical protein AN935_15795 [Bacillus inaquosorum]AWM19339.1 hypothetical protein DKG76_16630 [Bacillus inaquosorum]ELS60088.1 hypothetical protein BSI_36040 [Bacillus inaquosorum KCTC 13429]
MYKERKGTIIVVLADTKKFASHTMTKFFLRIEITSPSYYFGFLTNYKETIHDLKETKRLGKFIIFRK